MTSKAVSAIPAQTASLNIILQTSFFASTLWLQLIGGAQESVHIMASAKGHCKHFHEKLTTFGAPYDPKAFTVLEATTLFPRLRLNL